MAVRLTKSTLNGIQRTGKEFFVWDDDLPGFGVRVRPSGAMSWVCQYRAGSGRSAPTRRLTLGAVSDKLPPEAARKLAKEKLSAAALGADPAAEKSERRAAMTLNDLADAYIERHVETKRKSRTLEAYKSVLDVHVRPAFGSRRAADITKGEVARLHHDLSTKRTVTGSDGRKRTLGGTFVANRTVAVLSAMFSWADSAGLVPEGTNPCGKVERFKEEGRERFLTAEEIERLGAALREAETTGIPWKLDPERLFRPKGNRTPKRPENQRTVYGPHVTGAVRLLMLTGCRLREILNLEWGQVDLGRGLLFLPDSKTGRKTVVLSAPAAAVVAGLPRIGKFVIASDSAGTDKEVPKHDLKKPWSRIVERAGLEGLRLHDLRHTFASVGASSNLGLPVIGKLLGHTQASTTAKYSHLAVDPMKRAADLIAGQIAAAMGEPVKPAQSAEVIDIATGTRIT